MKQRRRKTKDERRKAVGPSSLVLRSSSFVVIGYGNDLRSDDGIGQQIARAVARWCLPGVRALAMHQLTPELAAELAQAHDAIFVDAYRTDGIDANVYVHPISPDSCCNLSGHSGDPGALLALAQAIYGQHPRAHLIAVPARSCAYGTDLSQGAKVGVSRALGLIRALIESQGDVLCTKSD